MNVEAQFTRIIEQSREKEIIPFLRGCTPEERRSLAPAVKKYTKHYTEFVDNGFGSWKYRGDDKQREILRVVQFVCYNRKEYESTSTLAFNGRDFLEKILPWYAPTWLGDYINGMVTRNRFSFDMNYDLVMWLMAEGHLQPSPELLAQTLVPIIFQQRERRNYYAPEKLTEHPVTLNEHVWHLFHVQTNVNGIDKWMYADGKKIDGSWAMALKGFCASGLLDRKRLLQESLLASNRNFDKGLSGWFLDLFESLEPNTEELLVLQEELQTLFSSPHSKVVNGALKMYKSIVDADGFPMQEFMDHSAVLLVSETKTTVTQALQIIEKIIKKDKAFGPEAARLAAALFIHKDETIQTRAARLIEKWGDVNDTTLRDSLSYGFGSMLSGPRTMLTAFLEKEESLQYNVDTDVQTLKLADLDEISLIKDVDELVFLCAQVFDNNQSWHIDQFLEAVLRLHRDIRGEDLEKFAPAVQQALKLNFGDFRSTQGLLDLMMAQFFLDLMLVVSERFPDQSASLKNLYDDELKKNANNWNRLHTKTLNVRFLSSPNKHVSDVYKPWYGLMKAVLTCVENYQYKILLSTPTHTPWWIDPIVLIDRIAAVHRRGLFVDHVDLEIALCRCWRHEPTEAIARAEQKLDGEFQRLILFLLDKSRNPTGPFALEHAWMTAAIVKDPNTVFAELSALPYSVNPRSIYTGQFAWKTVKEDYTYQKSDWTTGKYRIKTEHAMRKLIKIEVPRKPTPVETGISKIISFFKTGRDKKVVEAVPLIFEQMGVHFQYQVAGSQDIQRIYGLVPSNPEPLMAAVLKHSLSQNLLSGELDKRMVVSHLQCVHEQQPRLGEMGHLYLSACFLCSDKTAATYAAEIWIQQHASLDNQLLGKMLGTHQRIEFAPMKRLTDLLVAKMTGVSTSCDAALETLLSAMLLEIQDAPVRGMKKLLEIHGELQKRLKMK